MKQWMILFGFLGSFCLAVSPRSGAAAVESGGNIYLTGGTLVLPLVFEPYSSIPSSFDQVFSDIQVYDEASGDFVTNSNLPNFSYPRTQHTATIFNQNIYLWGGSTNNDIESFDILSSTWSILQVQGMRPTSTFGHAASILGNIIYVFGGSDANTGDLSDELWSFDLSGNIWNQIIPNGSQPSARKGHSMISYISQGKEYLILLGGVDNVGSFPGDIWIFDIALEMWQNVIPGGSIIPPVRAFFGAQVFNDKLYIFQGESPDPTSDLGIQYLNDIWSLNLLNLTLQWSPEDSMVGNGSRPWGKYAFSSIIGISEGESAIYVFGGKDGGRETRGDIWTFGISSKNWTQQSCWPGYVFPNCVLDCSGENYCNGNGICLGNNRCLCNQGYSGSSCDSNQCSEYRGISANQLNSILLPDSVRTLFYKLNSISRKLNEIRTLLPEPDDFEIDMTLFSQTSFEFYQYCLSNSLEQVASGFNEAFGCHVPCGSETRCILNDTCINGKCTPGVLLSCPVPDLCHSASCTEDPSLSPCILTPLSCDDSNPCTTDSCDPSIGCLHVPISCDDNDPCTYDSCSNVGQCAHDPTCNDGNPCTQDICNAGQCSFIPQTCCYLSLGQFTNLSTSTVPAPLGSPIRLSGSDAVPPEVNQNSASGYFWLQACSCNLIYDIQLDNLVPDTLETGGDIYGPAGSGMDAGVVESLSPGLRKTGTWNFCDRFNSTLVLDELFYVEIYLTTGDIRAQIRWAH